MFLCLLFFLYQALLGPRTQGKRIYTDGAVVVAFVVGVVFVGRPYSDATAEKMDLEARQMVDSAYQRTLELVENKKEQVGRESPVATHRFNTYYGRP